MKVAFIGIGLMGLPMSKRLAAAGVDLTVWNRSPEKCLPLKQLGVDVSESLQSAVLNANLVFTCLTNSAAVKDVWQQVRLSLAEGTVIVDCSSIDPVVTAEISSDAQGLNCHWIDCPVSGGVPGAEAGTLAMMAGGKKEIVDLVRPLLSHLSSKVTYMGESGSGQYAKICNQMIVSCNALVIAEVVAFAEKAGVNSHQLAEAFSGGFADSKPLQILAPEMAERRFEPPKWYTDTLLKDLAMAVEHLEKHSASAPMTSLAQTLMKSHSDSGFGLSDPSTLVKRYIEI